jgi:2'-5' RNA ligase
VVQSVELLLDPRSDDAVRRQWQALADAGLTSPARHTSASNRPHVTLAVSRRPFPDDVESAVAAAVATGSFPVPARLGGLLLFGHGDRYVLARLVVPSAELLAVQARVAAAVGDASGAVPHTAPGRWTPHVTLARSLRGDAVPAALTALAALPGGAADLNATGVAVRRWDGEARREWPVAP